MELTQLKYPNMRDELLYHLKNLSDESYQKKVWVDKNYPPDVEFDNFDFVVHFLFDDTVLGDNPQDAIGIFLINELEADLISKLISSLNLVFQKYGTNLSDEEYIEKPEWKQVLETTKNAYKNIKH